jgi:hypothetical protein
VPKLEIWERPPLMLRNIDGGPLAPVRGGGPVPIWDTKGVL